MKKGQASPEWKLAPWEHTGVLIGIDLSLLKKSQASPEWKLAPWEHTEVLTGTHLDLLATQENSRATKLTEVTGSNLNKKGL